MNKYKEKDMSFLANKVERELKTFSLKHEYKYLASKEI